MTFVAPLAASAVADVLLDLFIVLLAAKLGDELFKRIGQPAIVGEILAGVLVGPAVFGLVELGETLEVFAELGVVFLLFWVGLETRMSDLLQVGKVAGLVGVLGVILPFGGGIALGFGLGEETGTALFLGAALVATSVGITSAVLLEMKAMDRMESRVILGAAIVDDILALVLVGVATGIAESGEFDPLTALVVLAIAVAFVGFVGFGGTKLLEARPAMLEAPKFSSSPLLPAVILCLGLAAFAAEIGLAAIIGAFLAGMMVAETKDESAIEAEVAPLYALFPPFFFVVIGMQVDLEALADLQTDLLLLVVTVVAIVTKFAGAWLGSRSLGSKSAAFVGVGMVPRGEVGIIVASIGAATGAIDEELFAVIVGMSILTTLVVPPVLRRLADT
ncbi:MAG: cation:proton antiporter [Solirubrobacteraceae bacterium]|nr:cation:proton antiporter [Solirubrobacteraceae bacterium]